MKLWHLVSLALFLPWVGQTPAPQGLSKAQKDALLSRKTWYMSYEFTVSGNGSSESGAGETHTKLDWKVGRRTTGTIELNFAIPGQWLPSWKIDPLALTPGRFISWRPMPSEKVQELIAKGERNPANLPGVWFPYYPETLDRFESWGGGHHDISTYELNGVGYTDGTCSLHLDLQDNIYEVTFQSQASSLGDKAKRKWRNKYANEPEVVGSEELEIPEQYTAWFPDDAKPVLIRRKLLQDLKSDGSIVFSHAGTMDLPQGKVGYGVTFRFSPTPPSVARLVIEPADPSQYQKWRPKPGRSEDNPGNSLDVKYTVEEPGVPDDKQAKVNKLTLRLGNVSKYQGVCMNWPLAPSGPPKPDLRFKTVKDTATLYYSMGQENETVTVIGAGDNTVPRTGKFTIECLDGAAIGEVVAEAELKDGRVLTAEVRGQSAMKKLLIPDREEGVSDVARYWRDKYAPGQKDEEDEENDPEGDGQKGDGFTLWEEYRGFRQSGVWRDNCEPKKKDLFIENRVGGSAQPGIRLFASATGIAVHDKISDKEHQQDRKINFNSRADRHVTDQHCLILRVSADPNAGTAEQHFGAAFPGPPKNTQWVNVVMGAPADRIFGTLARGQFVVGNYDNSMVAHELGHAIAMYHHGDIDPWTDDIFGELWKRSTNASGVILNNGVPIRVVDEPSARVLDPPEYGFQSNASDFRAFMGYQNGQHSGDFNCIMRYAVARFYVQTAVANSRVYHGMNEHPGLTFCGSPAGTDFNQTSNRPNSRYGDADTTHSRGDCSHQFVISDRWDAKVRLAPEPVSFLLGRRTS